MMIIEHSTKHLMEMINKIKTNNMAIYNNERDSNDTMWENEMVKDKYFEAIRKHDYSHMYSDDDRAWRSGKQSEDEIKQYIHTMINILREDAEQLLEDSIYEVKEGYTDGLTHKVIRSWFTPYVENVNNINVKPTFGSYAELEKLGRGKSKY